MESKLLRSVGFGLLFAATATVLLFAAFNLRLGFGAQSVDCIDSHFHVIRYTIPSVLNKGDLLVFEGPDQMGDRFAGHLVIKKLAAVQGDLIETSKGSLFINGVKVGELPLVEKAAKEMDVPESYFERKYIVPKGHVFMLGTKERTYDSRYWGTVHVRHIVGSAYPVI